MKNLHITTQRLQIRNLELTDLAAFHAYRSIPEVAKYQGYDVMSMEQAEEFIRGNSKKSFGRPGQWIQYGIENKEAGKIIGDCALRLHQNDTRIAEIGITISPSEQQKGYAKESLNSLLEFLFEKLKIHRVVETVDAENMASINLLKSTGFRQEGYFIENIFFKGKWGSEYQFAMLRREWEQRSQN